MTNTAHLIPHNLVISKHDLFLTNGSEEACTQVLEIVCRDFGITVLSADVLYVNSTKDYRETPPTHSTICELQSSVGVAFSSRTL